MSCLVDCRGMLAFSQSMKHFGRFNGVASLLKRVAWSNLKRVWRYTNDYGTNVFFRAMSFKYHAFQTRANRVHHLVGVCVLYSGVGVGSRTSATRPSWKLSKHSSIPADLHLQHSNLRSGITIEWRNTVIKWKDIVQEVMTSVSGFSVFRTRGTSAQTCNSSSPFQSSFFSTGSKN